ncbi:MAG TPA: hypothetical protein VHQ47_12905 [Phycisphaerae bacterium]|nr:hypothetical protein [Phycisphaerae bacterium]
MFRLRKRSIPPPRKRAADINFDDLGARLLITTLEVALSAKATALLFGFRPDAPPDRDPNDTSPPPPPLRFPLNLLASETPMHVWLEIDNQLYQHIDSPLTFFMSLFTIIPERTIRVPPTPGGPESGDYMEVRPTATARRFLRFEWQWRADNLSGIRLFALHEIPLNASLPHEDDHYNPWAAPTSPVPASEAAPTP